MSETRARQNKRAKSSTSVEYHDDDNEDKERPRKRTRRGRLQSRSSKISNVMRGERTLSPIPLIRSDISGAPLPKVTRHTSRKILEAQNGPDEGEDSAPNVSPEPPSSPSQSNKEGGQEQANVPELRELKSRIAELEHERNDYRANLHKEKATSMSLRAQILLFQATASPEHVAGITKPKERPPDEQYNRQPLDDDLHVEQLQKELEQLWEDLAQLPGARKTRKRFVFLAGKDNKLQTENEELSREKKNLTDEVRELTTQSARLLSERDAAMKELTETKNQKHENENVQSARISKLEKDLQEAHVTSQKASSDYEGKLSSLRKTNSALRQVAKVLSFPKAAIELQQASNGKQDLPSNTQISEAGLAKLQSKNKELASQVAEKTEVQRQLEIVTASLKKAEEYSALKEKECENVTVLESAKRQLELENDEQIRENSVLKERIAELQKRRRELVEKKKELQTRLLDAEAKIASLTEANDAAKANGHSLQEENSKNIREIDHLKAEMCSLTEISTAAKAEEKSKYMTEISNLEAKVKQQAETENELATNIKSLTMDLEAKKKEVIMLKDQLRESEAGLASSHRQHDAALQNERKQHTEFLAALETKVKDLNVKMREMDVNYEELKNCVRDRDDRIAALTITAQNHKTALDDQKAELEEASTLRELNQRMTETLEERVKTIQKMKSHLKYWEKKLSEEGRARQELEKRARGLEMELQVQGQEFQTAQDQWENKVFDALRQVEGHLQQHTHTVFDTKLQKRIQTVIDTKLHELNLESDKQKQEFQQKFENFLGRVRSQIGRKIEERHPEDEDENADESLTMERIQEMLPLKLDYIERELNWYKAKFVEKQEHLKEAVEQRQAAEDRLRGLRDVLYVDWPPSLNDI
ncbi:hypothetical protein VPNG_04131 [Cytospora leucostoma]|uniref:Uncharacterized protein n=1 Tax=Cytospora leucostoma TaxID=1230097 RepID=A0A423XD58_9PEZI|nr:hypothetical protein VPNG_04131 [Cytospora leucostoma]